VSQLIGGRLAVSSNYGQTWTQSSISVNDTIFDYGLGISAFDGKLYLAYVGNNGVSVATSVDGIHFTYQATVSSLPIYNESEWLESPTVTTYTYQNTTYLYVGYLTAGGGGGYPVICRSTDGTTWTSQEFTNTILRHDLTMFTYDSALYMGGQSFSSADNLWLAGAYDGISFPAAVEYGPTLNNSPTATNFNGAVYMNFRSNFGENMWYAYANP
jgi:hypothetical protein